jgi:hypothetical protein
MPASAGPTSFTEQQLSEALVIYPNVVRKTYHKRIKAEKKQVEAVERDQWRYGTLPREVVDGKAITLEQLERLVQWKM